MGLESAIVETDAQRIHFPDPFHNRQKDGPKAQLSSVKSIQSRRPVLETACCIDTE